MSQTSSTTTQTQKVAWAPEQRTALYRAGLGAGTSLAAASILLDLLRSSYRRQKAEEEGKETNQPRALKLILPHPALMGKTASGLTEPLLATLLAGGTYYGWRKLYKEWRKKELQKEVEDQSLQYMNLLADKNKVAAILPDKKAFSVTGALAALPRDIVLLSALAGGIGTYGILENTFPKAKEKPNVGAPRKIVVKGYGTVFANDKQDGPLAQEPKRPVLDRENEAAIEQQEEEGTLDALELPFGEQDMRKAAAFLAECLIEAEPATALKEMAGQVILRKSAQALSLAVAREGAEAVLGGRGGSACFAAASVQDKKAAVWALFDTPTLRPLATTLTVAEFNDKHPGLAKLAAEAAKSPTHLPLGTKCASCLYDAISFDPVAHAKAAGEAMEWQKRWRGASGQSKALESEDNADQKLDGGEKDPIDQLLNA
jgi:hypothetical protein